jgi:hypothetical protein
MRYGKILLGGSGYMTIWLLRIACWIPKATNTQFVILIAFSLQQWLHQSTSVLRYMYIVLYICLSLLHVVQLVVASFPRTVLTQSSIERLLYPFLSPASTLLADIMLLRTYPPPPHTHLSLYNPRSTVTRLTEQIVH